MTGKRGGMKYTIRRRIRFGFFLIMAWMVPMPLPVQAQLIFAHRGASHDAPENTLAAFQLAWEQGADGIECDFRVSGDGHIVCIHDATTLRTAGLNLEVAETPLADLKRLDVGRWKGELFAGQRIPTLAEVIAIVPAGKRIVIELKSGPEIVAPLQQVLNDSDLQPQQVIVISFDRHAIAESRRRLPAIRTHWLAGYEPDDETGPWTPTAQTIARIIRETGADGFGSEARRRVLNRQFLSDLQAAGVREFHVWTVDDPDDARYFRQLGAAGITTNRPDLIRRELKTPSP